MQPFSSSTATSKLMILCMLLHLSFLAAKMTMKGGTSQACAACKYQRRRCSLDCALAPFFPADQPKMFLNAHRLFGVSNIMKILKQLDDDQKEEAMRSIIYESNIRERFPVHGCWGIICRLHQQLRQCVQELHFVRTQIAFYTEKIQEQIGSLMPPEHSPSSQLQLGITIHDASPICPHHYQYHSDIGTPKKTSWAQHPYFNKRDLFQDYYDIPFDTIADETQSKEFCESSAESSFKDTIQTNDNSMLQHASVSQVSMKHVSKNELKSAAASFSLTSSID